MANPVAKAFGWLGAITKAALSTVSTGRGGWFPLIRESFAGAWQQNVEIRFETVLSNSTDFACRTLIASDISKLPIRLVEWDEVNQIWKPTKNPAYDPVIRKPNHFQNRMQFFENWVLSKLQTGNTYILKERDNRNVVRRLYILDPQLVTPLISTSGDVYYQLGQDELTQISTQVVVPASEIIHDRFNCFFHPLVGLSPIFASGVASMQGIEIQNGQTRFFMNGSQPGGMLLGAGAITDETAKRLKEYWETNYTGKNRGKVAVLGDGLRYEAIAMKNVDAQLIEQLKWTSTTICSTYHVPPYKVGIGDLPAINNVQALNVEYYSQCLQVLLEAIEMCLDEGLNTGEGLGVEFDINNLLRMDTMSQMETLDKGRNYFTPNEGRQKLGLPKTEGGNVVLRQQQDFSLAALAKRDASPDPFKSGSSTTTTTSPAPTEDAANDNLEAEGNKALIELMKGLSDASV